MERVSQERCTMLGLDFTVGIMMVIFAVVIIGTGVAYWRMLTDPT
jgi:hypothetical protein